MNFQNQIDYLHKISDLDMFDNCTVPSPLILEEVETAIIKRCGLLEPQYTEPELMRRLTFHWFLTNQWTFNHLIKILEAEYSPIENTDRYSDIEETRTGNETGTTTRSGSDGRTTTHSGADTRTDTEEETRTGEEAHDGTDTTENTISAWNSDGYQSDNKSELAHGETIANEEEKERNLESEMAYGHIINENGTKTETINTSGTDEGGSTRTEHTHGNIGVTTNQELINQELNLLIRFNAYEYIASKFEREMMIQVY